QVLCENGQFEVGQGTSAASLTIGTTGSFDQFTGSTVTVTGGSGTSVTIAGACYVVGGSMTIQNEPSINVSGYLGVGGPGVNATPAGGSLAIEASSLTIQSGAEFNI